MRGKKIGLSLGVSEEKEQIRAKNGQKTWRGHGRTAGWLAGWLAVLADQISRMARVPLNRSYFRSCSGRARLTRRKTFDECSSWMSLQGQTIPSRFSSALREKSIRGFPRESRTIELDPFFLDMPVRLNDIGYQNTKSGRAFNDWMRNCRLLDRYKFFHELDRAVWRGSFTLDYPQDTHRIILLSRNRLDNRILYDPRVWIYYNMRRRNAICLVEHIMSY